MGMGSVNPINLSTIDRSVPIKTLQSCSKTGIASGHAKHRLNSDRTEHRLPRYTSYPTADKFTAGFTAAKFAEHLGAVPAPDDSALSLYIHVPFCQSLCYYCACNKTVTQNRAKVRQFVDALIQEIKLVAPQIGDHRYVTEIHWGGGTPTFLDVEDISKIQTELTRRFRMSTNLEMAIEVDPRSVDKSKIKALSELGFRRISLGIQDFDPLVQKTINRLQSVDLVQNIYQLLRSYNFLSINFDLIVGLPHQNAERFNNTLDAVVDMKPDRLAMFEYAHLPERFKAQRLLHKTDMPNDTEVALIRQLATERFLQAGYSYIGMDHYALPDDELAIAHRSGRLNRNFQGYTAHADHDLLGMGPSAISRIGACYNQNLSVSSKYIERIQSGQLATERGVELNQDDLLRRSVISTIMCHGRVDKSAIEATNQIDFDAYFAAELEVLQKAEAAGLVAMKNHLICVTERGSKHALRNVASIFDRYLAQRIQQQSLRLASQG